MKKVIKVLSIAFLSLTLFTSKVKAVNITVSSNNGDTSLVCDGNCHGIDTNKEVMNTYYTGTYDGKSFSLYCKDPGLNLDSGQYSMTVTRLDPNNQHDAGIIYILENSGSMNKSAVQETIRFYDYLFGLVTIPNYSIDNKGLFKNVEFTVSAADYFAKKWGIDLSGLNISLPSANNKYKNIVNYYSDSTFRFGNSESSIETLLKNAIDAAKTANSTENNSSDKKVIPVKEGHVEDKSSDTEYIQEIEYTYTIEGFDKDSEDDSILLQFDCPNCNSIPGLNVNVGIAAAGGYSESLDLAQLKNGIEVLGDYIKTSEKKPFTILITFSVNKANYDCNNKPRYSLDLAYTGKKEESKYAMFEVAGEEATTHQVTYGDGTYVFFTEDEIPGGEGYIGGGDNNGNGENGNKDYTHLKYDEEVQLCSGNCDNLKNDCETEKRNHPGMTDDWYKSNIPACKEYEELECDQDTPKATCNVYVSSATCSDTPSELIIREGTSGLSPCDTNSKVDVYSCVTENGAADNIGNEYKQTTMQPNSSYSSTFGSGAFDVSNNRFCNVACIENYRITLPPSQNDNAGRYFQISATLEGNKSCYTSEIKKGDSNNPLASDSDTFEYMFEVYREQAIEYYNLYMFYNALNSASNNTRTSNKTEKQNASYVTTGYSPTTTCSTWESNGWVAPWGNQYLLSQPVGYLNMIPVYPQPGIGKQLLPHYSWRGKQDGYVGDPQIVCNNYFITQTTKTESFDRLSSEITFTYDTYSYNHNLKDNPANNNTPNVRLNTGRFDTNGNKLNLTSALNYKGKFFDISCTSRGKTTTCTITSYGDISDGGTSVTKNEPISIINILKLLNIYVKQSANGPLKEIYDNYTYTNYSGNATNADNEIENLIKNYMLNLTKELAQCTGWDMKFNFNPTLTFDYEEEYLNNDKVNKNLEALSGGSASSSPISIDSSNTKYCKGKITYNGDTGEFESCDSGTVDVNNLFPVRKNMKLYNKSGEMNVEFHINEAKTAYQTIPVSQEYVTPVQFRTLSPSGAVVIAPSDSTTIDDSLIIPGWPIEFAHQGVFTYKIQVNNLGEFNNGDLGRIWSQDKQIDVVRKAEADKGTSCTKSSIDDEGKYFCSYKVNCNDCPSECDPTIGICEDPNCPDGNCPSSCNPEKGVCIVDGELNVSPRPVSPNNVNPNGRPFLGKNWAWDDTIDSYLELKAFVTTQEIQENGETIFETDFDANYNETNVFAINYGVKFHLTGDVINYIKNTYNRGRTYSDNSLECYPYTNNNTGETFDGMFCYSKFIDTLIEEFDDAVEIQGTRPLPNERNLETHSWWTTWDQAGPSVDHWRNGQITYSFDSSVPLTNLKYATDSGTQIGIGPAWK